MLKKIQFFPKGMPPPLPVTKTTFFPLESNILALPVPCTLHNHGSSLPLFPPFASTSLYFGILLFSAFSFLPIVIPPPPQWARVYNSYSPSSLNVEKYLNMQPDACLEEYN
jgi:hypothetical protein